MIGAPRFPLSGNRGAETHSAVRRSEGDSDVAEALVADATKRMLVIAPRINWNVGKFHPRTEKEITAMTKAELIDAVAKSAGISKVQAEQTLGAFFDHVVKATKKGDKVAWPGFGSFSTRKRPARMVRNPRTGEMRKASASTLMKFTASSTLKATLNPKK